MRRALLVKADVLSYRESLYDKLRMTFLVRMLKHTTTLLIIIDINDVLYLV